MHSAIVVVFLSLVALCGATGCDANQQYSGGVSITTPFVGEIAWAIDCTQQTIDILFIAEATGWIGVGWNTEDAMYNADTAFAWQTISYEFILRSLPHQAQVTNRFLDQSYVYDIRAGNHAGPIVDEFNFFDYEVAQNATHTSVSFSKRLDTGDASGDIALTPSTSYYLVAAVAASTPTDNDIAQARGHFIGGVSTRFIAPVNFFGDTASTTTTTTSASSSVVISGSLFIVALLLALL